MDVVAPAAGAEHVDDAGVAVLADLVDGLQHFRQLQRQRGAVAAQCVQCARVDQRFQRTLVELGRIDALAEIEQVAELASLPPRLDDALAHALAHALHRAQAVADGAGIGGHEHEVRMVHVRRPHVEAQPARFVEEADHLLGLVHVRGQRGGHELGRVVLLQPRGLVGDQRVRGGVRLVEAVAGELLHQVEDLVGLALVHAALGGALAEDLAVLGHFGRHLLAHRAAQQVGAAQRVAADDLRHLHDLLLVDHDAVGLFQHGPRARVGVFEFFAAVLALDERRDHVHRAGAVQRVQRDQVFETIGLGFLQRAAHARGFELEHRARVAVGEHVAVDAGVVQGNGGDVERRQSGARMPRVDRLHRPVDDRQRAQAQEVELHQADRFHVVLVELGDRVLAAPAFVVFGEQRAEVRQRRRRDHHAAGVLAGVAGEVFQLPRQVDQVADVVLVAVAVDQFLRRGLAAAFAHRVLQRHAQDVGDKLGHAVDQAVREAEHAAGIAHHRLGRHRAVGDDLADAVAAVLARDVVDHLVAPVHAEVDVEVGHRHAFRVEEALEQQAVRQRVQVGDLQRPRHQRAGAGAAARADRDAVVLSPLDEVGHDQEVAGEAHLADGVQLEIQPLLVVLARMAGRQRILLQARLQAVVRLAAYPAVQRFVVGHGIRGQEVRTQPHLDVAALRQRPRVVDGVRHVGEQFGHLLGRLHVLLGAVFARALGVVQHAAGRDAHARFVRVEIVRRQEAHVVAGDHRHAAGACGMQGEGIERLLAIALRARQFKVQVLAERTLPVGQVLFGQVVTAGQRQTAGQALPADDGEQALVVGAQPFRLDGDAVGAVAFHPCAREQPRQRQVAFAVAAQQGHRPWRFAAFGDHHVGAGDGLDAHALGGLVELHQREQVVAVGDRQRGHAQFHRPAQQVGLLGLLRVGVVRLFGHADDRIRKRKLGVQVEVDETGRHAGSECCQGSVPAGVGWGKA